MNVAEAIKKDRERRGNLSRKAYADLIGTTSTKVANIENGRKLKGGEREMLEPFIGDLLLLESTDEAPVVDQTDEWATKRQQLQRDYDTVIDALAGKPASIPWPLVDTTIAEARPQDLERIQNWIDQMYHAPLNGSGPTAEPPTEPGPSEDPTLIAAAETEIEHPYTGVIDDGEDWDEVAYFEDVTVISPPITLMSWGPVLDSPFKEGGPEATAVEALSDDFPVRDER